MYSNTLLKSFVSQIQTQVRGFEADKENKQQYWYFDMR